MYIAMLLLFTTMFISVYSLLLWFGWVHVPLSLLLVHLSVHLSICVDLVLPDVEVFLFLSFSFMFCCHVDFFSHMER